MPSTSFNSRSNLGNGNDLYSRSHTAHILGNQIDLASTSSRQMIRFATSAESASIDGHRGKKGSCRTCTCGRIPR